MQCVLKPWGYYYSVCVLHRSYSNYCLYSLDSDLDRSENPLGLCIALRPLRLSTVHSIQRYDVLKFLRATVSWVQCPIYTPEAPLLIVLLMSPIKIVTGVLNAAAKTCFDS